MSPRDPREDDQPDAMDQGVHIAVSLTRDLWSIECDCGDTVPVIDWEMHCENEGE